MIKIPCTLAELAAQLEVDGVNVTVDAFKQIQSVNGLANFGIPEKMHVDFTISGTMVEVDDQDGE